MKNYFLVAISALLIGSCNDSGETHSTTNDTTTVDTSLREYPASPIDTGMNRTDTSLSATTGTTNDFVNKAAAGGLTEVEMGKLAQSNGNSDDVKNYGKMLEKDHSEANSKLKDIAASENISMPASMLPEQKQHIDHLQSLKGKDFDKAYMEMMIEDHKKDIAEFKKAAASNENPKVKTFASATLPTLETHLAKAKSISGKLH